MRMRKSQVDSNQPAGKRLAVCDMVRLHVYLPRYVMK